MSKGFSSPPWAHKMYGSRPPQWELEIPTTTTPTTTALKRIDWLAHDPPWGTNGNDITACQDDLDRFELQQRPIGCQCAYIIITGHPIGEDVPWVFS